MPELADVEGFRRTFDRHAASGEVRHVSAPMPGLLRNTTAQGLGRALHGRTFEPARRHGKWLIAGLGNELSDEILWRARLAPHARVASLSKHDRGALFDHLKDVLEASIARGRFPEAPGWLESARGDPDGRCPRCDHALAHVPVAGGTAVCCPRCQAAEQ